MSTLFVEQPQFLGRNSLRGSLRLLLVDEDASDLAHYQRILEAEGYQVRSCSSYLEAVLYLDHETFDFIVVDHGFGGPQWRVVLESAADHHRRIPVLVVTRARDMVCYLEAMQLGAVDYLEKPLTPAQHVRVLNSHRPPQKAAA